jgi:hypothetical protein
MPPKKTRRRARDEDDEAAEHTGPKAAGAAPAPMLFPCALEAIFAELKRGTLCDARSRLAGAAGADAGPEHSTDHFVTARRFVTAAIPSPENTFHRMRTFVHGFS